MDDQDEEEEEEEEEEHGDGEDDTEPPDGGGGGSGKSVLPTKGRGSADLRWRVFSLGGLYDYGDEVTLRRTQFT